MNLSDWRKAATSVTQHKQEAAMAETDQLSSMPLSQTAIDDSGPPIVHYGTHIVAVSDIYWDNISDGYSIPDEIPTTLAFSPANWCKIDVFTSNIMVLHHKMPQTVKINVNRYTHIYLLMNLFKINQFMLIFSCISALFSFIQQTIFNHFVFLLLLIV